MKQQTQLSQSVMIGLVILFSSCSAERVTPPVAHERSATSTPSASGTTAPSTPISKPIARSTRAILPEESPPEGTNVEFKTDFKRHTVPYGEILSGGPPKDGIPAIDTPAFISVIDADAWLKSSESVAMIHIGDDARAYPVQILTWHEIVNDAVGGVPLAVTYCPLCNTAIAFERTFDGRVHEFGTTGRLRYSNMVMYDRQTETWWQQGTGEAIVGELAGQRLIQRPMTLMAWSDFKTGYPTGKVLSRNSGYSRRYGVNPYAGYDNPETQPFLYRGPATPNQLPPLARVLTLDLNDDPVAFPYEVLAQQRAITDVVGGAPIVVFWTPGARSPLDAAEVADGREIGAAAAFSRQLDGVILDFKRSGESIVDVQTGSRWNGFGRAIDGSLKGKQLEEVIGTNHFWFSWAAFHPNTRVRDAVSP